jgi:ABC-type transport system involved in cytochrome c biogenesis permease component
MSDLFILYLWVSYFYMLGAIGGALTSIGEKRSLPAFFTLLLAPLTMPILIGMKHDE